MNELTSTDMTRKGSLIMAALLAAMMLLCASPLGYSQVSVGAGIPFDDLISDAEEDAEKEVEEQVTTNVDAQVDSAVEQEVDDQVEEVVENSVGDAVQGDVEQSVAQTVENTTESTVEETVAQSAEATVSESVEEHVSEGVQDQVDTAVGVTVADRIDLQIDSKVDQLLDSIESGIENDEGQVHTNQWLVMAEPEVFEHLAREGYVFDAKTDLPGMGLQLAEVSAPDSFDLDAARRGVMEVVGKNRADVDLNHLYTAGTPVREVNNGISPRSAVQFPDDMDELPLSIGMIDSAVDVSHPALRKQHIKSRTFVSDQSRAPSYHGTAIASILAGKADADGYSGIAPEATVYSASVFENDPKRGEVASTISLVRALDWLIVSGVDVVNISLAGPPNRLLETALTRASQKDVLLLAAAGNGGPVAKPAYPAAYDSVVAVTAVTAGNKVFRLANRGSYLDLAAPGVDLRHARAGGGYTASSGTSFAVPFAAAAAARLRHTVPELDVLDVLFSSVIDLGPPGRDDIYGHGLITPGA